MQNIHVKRYESAQKTGFQGCIEPEDGSWIVFIDDAGDPDLWLQVDGVDSDGQTVRGYMPASEIPNTSE